MEDVYEKMVTMFNETGSHLKVKLTFKEPVLIYPFTTKQKINKIYDSDGRLRQYEYARNPKKVYELFLKKSTSGVICFSNRELVRKVYPVWALGIDYSNIESLEYIPTKDIDWDLKNRDYVLNNIHENLWPTLKTRLSEDDYKEDYLIKENSGRRIKTVSMSSEFPNWVCKELKDAIENKKPFSYSKRGTKRDKSVTVQIYEDGSVNAFYSSEYSNCGNGDYYLLINPTTAIFCETD